MLKSELIAMLAHVPDACEVILMYRGGDTCPLRVMAYNTSPERPLMVLEPVRCAIDNDTGYLRA